MNAPNNLPTRPVGLRSRVKSKKITVKQPPQTSSDMFTRLCHSELHAECIKEHRFYKPRKWRFDYALPRYKIAVEVEGGVWTAGRHIRPQGFLNDIEKYNTAALLGWRVFRTTPDRLLTGSTIKLLRNAMSGSFNSPSDDYGGNSLLDNERAPLINKNSLRL